MNNKGVTGLYETVTSRGLTGHPRAYGMMMSCPRVG